MLARAAGLPQRSAGRADLLGRHALGRQLRDLVADPGRQQCGPRLIDEVAACEAVTTVVISEVGNRRELLQYGTSGALLQTTRQIRTDGA